MTEVSSLRTNSPRPGTHSTILYDASPELAKAFGELMADGPREIIDRRGLKLASRAMHFQSLPRLQEFQANEIDPRLRRNADLARLTMTPNVEWESVRTPNGEVTRIYVAPRPMQEIALSSLYALFARREDVPYYDGVRSDRVRAGSLALTVAAADLAVSKADGLMFLRERLAQEQLRTTFYADNPRLYNPMR